MNKFFSFVIVLLFSTGVLQSQTLSIASSGQTGTSGTNWSISGNTLTVTGTASIQASVIEGHLAGGNDLLVTVPGNMTINEAISFTGSSAQTLTFNTRNEMVINQAISATNGSLSLVLASNYAYNSGGVDINANITTNGGHLVIGGGYNSTATSWNGLTIPGGNAASYTNGRDAVEIKAVAVNTGGGDIRIRANTNSSVNNSSSEYYAVEIEDAIINANGGDISIYGLMRGGYKNGAGVHVGTDGSVSTIETSGAGTIDITGDVEDRANSNYSWRHGVLIIGWSGTQPVTIRSEQGDISITGNSSITNSTNYDNSGLQIQNSSSGQVISIVSQSGAIDMTGTNTREASNEYSNGIRLTPNGTTNCIVIGQEGSTTYSGDVTINANSLRVQNSTASSIDVQTTGNYTIQPSGSSFTYYRVENQTADDFLFPTAWGLDIGGDINIGKSGNTGDLDIQQQLSAGGDITIYGGDVDIHNNLYATGAGSNITVYANLNIHTATTANVQIHSGDVSVTGGDIKLISDVDGNATGNIHFGHGLYMNSHGGNILLAGGDVNGSGYASGYITSSFENEGIRFEYTTQIESEGGNITMRGRNTTNVVASGYGNWGVGSYNNGFKKFNSGTGKIYIEGISRNGGGLDAGIGFYSSDSFLEFISANTSADAITFKGSSVTDEGILFTSTHNRIYATGQGGGINMEGTGNTYAINFQSTTDILAASGPINLKSTSSEAYVNAGGAQVTLGSKAGSTVTASSADITLSFDSYDFSGLRQNVNTTGDFTIQPADGSTSFSQAVSNDFFTWSSTQFPSSLTMGKSGNNAEISIDVDQTVAGSISLYGSLVDINANLTSSATGDILFRAIASGNDDINIASGKSITKSDGSGSFTAQANGRFNNGGSVTVSGSGSMNIIIWSDYNNTNNAGVSNIGTINSGGGHVWVGGSSTNGGSQTWNGLTVGDGGSTGSTSANQNGIDFNGSISSSGGDVYLWSADGTSAYSDLKFYSGSAINSGSGDITIISDEISNVAPCAITTTGHFTWEPNTTNGWATTYTNQLDVDGNYSGANYTGVVDFNDFQFINFSSFGGFTLGNTTQTCGIYLYDDISVNGPVELLGHYVAIGNDITAAGDILIDADLGSQISYSGIGVNILGTAQLSTTSNGNITVLGRGGTGSGGNQVGIVLNNGSSLISSGTGAININGIGGASSGNGNRGVALDNTTVQTAGADLTITGTGGGTGSSNSNDGISITSSGNTILAGAGTITLNGTANPVGASSESLSGDGVATIGGATQTGDVMLRGDNIWFGSSSNISTVQTSGAFTLEPYSNSFEGVAFSWPMSGLTLSGDENTVTLGKDGNTFDMTISGATTVAGDLTVYGGAIAVNAATTATSSTLTLDGTTISGAGALTSSKAVLESSTSTNLTGAVTATDVSLLGAGSATLSSTSSDFTTLEAGTTSQAVGALSITESNGFTVGSVDNAGINSSGNIDLSTQTGDLTISEAIATTATSTSAIVANAGKSKSVGDATGGNLIVSGNGALTMGSGAIAKLFSSDDASSTGLAALAASYDDVFPGYDESSDLSGFTLSGDKTYVFYRASSGSLTVTPSLVNFSHCGVGNSDPVAITISGTSLAQDVTVTVPNGYELATTSTGTYQSSLTLTQTSGTLASTTIYARATATISAEGSADLTLTSGTVSETVALVNGLNNSIDFDGTDDYLEITNTGQFDLTTMTLEGWFNADVVTTLGNNPVLFNMRTGDNSSLSRFSIHINLGQKIIGNFNGVAWNYITIPTLNINEWFHVAVTMTTSETKVYINGEYIGATANGINTGSSANLPVRIGIPTSSGSHSGEWWDGSVDDLRVWSTVRTATEIANNYQAPVASSSTGLMANLSFDQGLESGTNAGNTTVVDPVNGYNGALNNLTLSGSTSNFVEGYYPEISGGRTIITDETVQLTHPVAGGSWSTSDANVAVISSTGLVTGIGPGTATITYTGCDASATYSFTVAQQNSIDLDGSDDRIRLTETTLDNISGDVTIEAWIYFDAADGASGEIFMKNASGTGSAATNLGLRIRQGDIMLHLGNGSQSYATRTANEVPKQQWVHVAVVLDHGTDVKIYYNGEEQQQAAPQINGGGSVSINYNTNTTASVIGAVCTDLNSSYTNHFNGQIDELRIWNTARTASEIQANMGQQIDPTNADLAAYYQLNYGTRGATNTGIVSIEDLTGNGNDGTLQNSSLSGSTSNWATGFMPEITGNKFVLTNGTSQLENAVENGTWASSNTSVATIDQNGLVTAVAVGSTTITNDAMDNQVSKTLQVLDPDAMGPVTIVASGGDAENVDWTVTGGQLISTTTSAVDVNASDIIPHLASSDLVVKGSSVAMTGDLNTASSQTLTLKSRSTIVIDANADLITNGGSVILWANADGQTSNGNVILDRSTITTNGGHLWIGGGSGSTTWNSLTVGDGKAVAGADAQGTVGSSESAGLFIEDGVIDTDGGNISITAEGQISTAYGLLTIGTASFDAGAGTVMMDFEVNNSGYRGASIGHHHSLKASNFSITSSNASSNAIDITFDATAGAAHGSVWGGPAMIANTGTGGVTMTSIGTSGALGIRLGYSSTIGCDLKLLAASGPIEVSTGSTAIEKQNSSSSITLGSKASTSVTSSSSDITVTTSNLDVDFNPVANTTGTLTVKPTSGGTFASGATTSGMSLAGLSELVIGDAAATSYSDITVVATTLSGPMTIYGNNISVTGDITTSGDIRLLADGNISVSASVDFDATNDDIVLWADNDANGAGNISAGDNATFTSAGGNIYLAGGTDSDSDTYPDGFATSSSTHGVALGTSSANVSALTSGGGDIVIKGKCTNTTTSQGHGLAQRGLFDIDAGTGTVTIEGESSSWYGIDFSNLLSSSTPWVVSSSATSGTAISIIGTTTAASNYGVVFNFPINKQLIADGGGSIVVNGVGTAGQYGIFAQNVDFLASGGSIILDGGVEGIRMTDYGARFGSLAGSAVTSSTANISLAGDEIRVDVWRSGFSTKMTTSGTINFKPSTGSANGITWPAGTATSGWNVGTSSGSSTVFTWETVTVN